jgi:hypothetical protein
MGQMGQKWGKNLLISCNLKKNKKGSEALKNKGFSISCNLRTNQKSAGGGH